MAARLILACIVLSSMCVLCVGDVIVVASAAQATGQTPARPATPAGRGQAPRPAAPVAPKPPAPAPRPPAPAAAQKPAFFTTPYSLEEMRGKQAVVETSMGTIVLQLLPEAAPNHVGFFMKQARDGAYAGTAFHRVIRYGIIQGGDPISRDPAKTALYGSGGLNQLRFEASGEKQTAGSVSAALADGDRDSAGSQFFINASEQPGLDGQYTIFARVVEGIEVVQAISAVDAAPDGLPRTRVTIDRITIRDTPAEPFVSATVAEMAAQRAIVETTLGSFELELLPDKAPETVRAFLRMAQAGVYDGIRIHRVAPGFVIQMGALAYRGQPLRAAQQRLVGNLPPEFTDTPNLPGIVSMARGEDPNSGSTSFFICIGECRTLDGKYTVFARVAAGDETVKALASVPVDGETPRTPIEVTRVRVEGP
jgi:peptidyl-prolyl cis-trans isomerase B (cyclophilin B)